MTFSTNYAILFVLAGFAAGVYLLKNGKKAKPIPIIGMGLCILYTGAEYGTKYAMLTAIEYAVGFGISYAVVDSVKKEEDEETEKNK
jgi:hypothetical protein